MSSTTRILVTGGDGVLATALRAYFPFATYLGRKDCDVTHSGAVKAAFAATDPHLVIHCAALTRHDAEPAAYVPTNVQGTANVMLQAKRCGARLVYLSTDYVYPGLRGPYAEWQLLAPVNPYAASKAAGEWVARAYSNTLVVRGSWYSRLDLTHAATDAYTSRVPVDVAARWIAPLAVSTHTGVVNVGGARRSVYEIVATEFNPRVQAISRTALKTGYPYPADVSVDTAVMRRWLA